MDANKARTILKKWFDDKTGFEWPDHVIMKTYDQCVADGRLVEGADGKVKTSDGRIVS